MVKNERKLYSSLDHVDIGSPIISILYKCIELRTCLNVYFMYLLYACVFVVYLSILNTIHKFNVCLQFIN